MTEIPFPPYRLFETRRGAGTPVVLVHGLSGSSRWWARNVDALSEHHLVAAVDLTGFGRNRRFLSTPEVLPPFEEVAALLARWLETFGEPVHLVGHSMGGQISIHLAAERPELVRSLTLVSSAGMPFALRPGAHLRPLPKPPFGGWRIAQVLVPDLLRAGPTSVAAATARVLRDDSRELMRAIRVPTLLVWGENDPLVPLHYGEAMQREIAGSRLVVIPRAAHVAMWDNAAAFNDAVLDFIAEVESSPAAARGDGAFGWGVSGWHDGIAYRQSGRRRDIVLLHGLGMSSAYFLRFARELFARGWNPIAPDLPGFGESANATEIAQHEQAERLIAWADALAIRDAVWVGHSLGCNAVAHVAALRPDLVRGAALLGPLWTRSDHPKLRLAAVLALDALREPLRLYRYVIPAYWRAGLWRWWRTFCLAESELRARPTLPPNTILLAGARDPIPDRPASSALGAATRFDLPGAHACHFSCPAETAEAIGVWISPPSRS